MGECSWERNSDPRPGRVHGSKPPANPTFPSCQKDENKLVVYGIRPKPQLPTVPFKPLHEEIQHGPFCRVINIPQGIIVRIQILPKKNRLAKLGVSERRNEFLIAKRSPQDQVGKGTSVEATCAQSRLLPMSSSEGVVVGRRTCPRTPTVHPGKDYQARTPSWPPRHIVEQSRGHTHSRLYSSLICITALRFSFVYFAYSVSCFPPCF